ncbi:protein kinase domain-containing protein [Myxococcus fulvus]|uniref:protein kinase domain-containing protein n=1 Tax=Myxococcus fulvus TaxID=33 RepID=UPI003B9C896D
MTQEPQQSLGRYELLAQLGRGGMAETWRARLVGAAGVTKPVLIKKVLPEHANDEAFIAMFISEARISATLSHGNIAQVFDFGRMDGQYFLAMELVDGQPLHRVLRRAAKTGLASMPIPLATYIAVEMCRGLHYAHSRTDDQGVPLHIVHRDISPDNVLVSYEGQVKIVDFGIAKARMLRSFHTEPGIVRGKYLYFSPEQARGYEVDARTDVWATGLVLYEMLCGQPPVSGSEALVMSKLAHGEFPSPRQVRKELPSALNEIVMRALSVDASFRYESANAFGDALAGFLHSFAPRFGMSNLAYLVRELFREDLLQQGRDLAVPAAFVEELSAWRGTQHAPTRALAKPARARTGTAPTAPLPAGLPVEPPPSSPPELERRSSRWGLLAAGGLVAMVALAILPWVLDDGPPPAPPPPPGPLAPLGQEGPEVPAGSALGTSDSTSEVQGGAVAESVADHPDATSIRLDSRRHVFRVPVDMVAFFHLDASATYSLWEPGFSTRDAQRAVLEPGVYAAQPIFYLLAGDAVPVAQRQGVVPRRPVALKGIRSISLFTLGEPVKEDLSQQNVSLREPRERSERRFAFHPEPMRVSTAQGFLLRGLDVRQTYTVSLAPVGEGVFPRGREQGPANHAACVEWSPSGTPPKLDRYGDPIRMQPVRFFLSGTREVKVRGIQGLRCGLLDDDVSDNEGEVEVRVGSADARRPRSPSPVSSAPDEEAARLYAEAQRLSRAGKTHDAFLLAEDCLSNVPEQASCLLLSGAMQARLNRMEGARERYRTFVKRYPAHPEAARVRRLLEDYSKMR